MKKPTSSQALKLRIAELEVEAEILERDLTAGLRSVGHSLHPSSMAKELVHELAEDPDVRESAAKALLKAGSRFVAFKVLGRFGGAPAAVGAAVAGAFSDQFINRAVPGLLKAAGSLFGKKSDPAADTEPEVDPTLDPPPELTEEKEPLRFK